MELHELSLSEAKAGLLRGEYGPGDLLRSCCERIRSTEGAIHACVRLLEEEALKRAEELERAGPREDQPLWGLPLTLTDNICLQGSPATCASAMLKDFIPFYDAEAVARLKQAGAIILAKNNLDEFGMGTGTEYSAFGPSANPWNLERIPGGACGGAAASVAAGQTFGALGSDTGGSIRIPAGFCGCVGLKPTYGLVSRFGLAACGSSFEQIGPLTRTVEDCARLLEVIAGPDPKDSTSARLDLHPENLPPQNFVEAALEGARLANPGLRDGLKGLKIGLPEELWDADLIPEVEERCRAAMESLAQAGAELIPVSLPHQKYAVPAYCVLSAAEAGTNLAGFDGALCGFRAKEAEDLDGLYTASRSRGFGPEVRRRVILGTFALSSGYYDAYYRKAAQVRRLLRQDFDRVLKDCRLLAAPTATRTARLSGFTGSDPLLDYKTAQLTVALNLAGLPGLTLPVGLGKESGLPVGLQLMGRPFDEAGILKCAAVLEQKIEPLGKPAGLP